MTLIRMSALTAAAVLLTSTATFAAENDGFYNVSYNDIGLSLTQIGGFGELKIESNGFKSMSYGTCLVNFTRDEAGAVKDMSPVATVNSAKCPEALKFSIAPSDKGMYKITFTEGGDLAGETLDLYPVLVPMSDKFTVTAPKGFDILGLTPGLTRAELEASLTEKGFTKNDRWSETQEYTNGMKQSLDVWQKGQSDFSDSTPEDAINITYTTIAEGEEEVALLIGRKWHIPKSANLSITNLKKSLDDKHGATTSGFEKRIYNRAGELQPDAFQPACAEDVHLQSVSVPYRAISEGGTTELSASCGEAVEIMTMQSYDVAGAASQLNVTIAKGDLAYADFWKSWAPGELKGLEERYNLQANMTGATPNL